MKRRKAQQAKISDKGKKGSLIYLFSTYVPPALPRGLAPTAADV